MLLGNLLLERAALDLRHRRLIFLIKTYNNFYCCVYQ